MALESFDIASLEAFTADLVDKGFEPLPASDRRKWKGPIHPAFDKLTDARTMEIAFDVGWPYRPPGVFVQGLSTNHSMLNGLVCLWREGDPSLDWVTLGRLFSRIEDWCWRARNGWQDDHLPFDAYLNFKQKLQLMSTFDFGSLRTGIGSWGDMHGVVITKPDLLNLRPGPAPTPRELRGLWFRVDQLQSPPPRNLSELPQHLNRSQQKGLRKALSERHAPARLRPRGGVDIILFAWQRRERTDLLIMACEGIGDNVDAAVLVAEPNDERTLRLRAGPDAEVLKGCRAVLFGVGALGGHVAVTLAESGIESLRIVDDEFLSPGNVVRHVAGHDRVGDLKVNAVEAVIKTHAPWTGVKSHDKQAWKPSDIAGLMGDADVVIDATGNDAFLRPVAQVADELGKALISGALFRGGFIGRIQRKALDTDAPISGRPDCPKYPIIPPGDPKIDLAEPDLGCSAPVNNAPPASVHACASLIAQAAIDVLTGRFEFEDEMIDVYRPLPGTQFDRIGRGPGESWSRLSHQAIQNREPSS